MEILLTDKRGDIVLMADDEKITAISSILKKLKIIYSDDNEYVMDFDNSEILYENIKYGEIKSIEILSENEDVIMSMDYSEFKVNSDTIGKFQITDDNEILRAKKFYHNKKIRFEELVII